MYVQLKRRNDGWKHWIHSCFLNSVLEGKLFQVEVTNELLDPIQLNIETLSSHGIKCMCVFILSVVS